MVDSNSGGTTARLAKRMQQIGQHSTKTIFHQHFLSDGHKRLMNDCEIIFIDETDSADPTGREFFCMRVLKTIAPLGYNIDESYDY